MITYIVRCLLLMIPTLIGMTFLIFMLVASRPGGIGAALEFSSGSAQSGDATSRALQRAYLDDRYGLDDPKVVQYLRWLHRISPINFGSRDQITPAGERIELPKEIDEPMLWEWFVDELPKAEASTYEPSDELPQDAEARQAELLPIYRDFSQAYSSGRARFVARSVDFEQAMAAYLKANGMERAVSAEGKVILSRVKNYRPDRDASEWNEVQTQFDRLLRAYTDAINAREQLASFYQTRSFDQAGIWIGFATLDWPDLGNSFSRREPVSRLIARALPVTLLLNLMAFPIIYLIAIPGGMLAATHQRSLLDVGLGTLFVALWSIPIVWAGVLAIGYLANDDQLGWFPVTGLHDSAATSMTFLPSGNFLADWSQRGYMIDTFWHMCLPVLCLVYGSLAILSKQTRAAMLDNFNQDYVRTAKAKGVAKKDIVLRHVFRNSLLPLITMFVQVFPLMLGGSVVVESIFTIEGMGKLILDAINLNDYEILLANAMIIGLVNMLALLLADILYAIADPRISYK